MSGQREIGESLAEVLQVFQVQTRTAGGTTSTYSLERTGAGKSLCMFLVPLALGESTVGVIISPLKAPIDQQVHMYHRGYYLPCSFCNFITVLRDESVD